MTRQIINPWTWQDHVGFVQGHAVNGGLGARGQCSAGRCRSHRLPWGPTWAGAAPETSAGA